MGERRGVRYQFRSSWWPLRIWLRPHPEEQAQDRRAEQRRVFAAW